MAGFFAAGLACLCIRAGPVAALPPGYSIETVHRYSSENPIPVALRFAPDGRLFVVNRYGTVLVYSSADAETASVWATIPVGIATADGGLLGLDFHPSFPDSPYVYLFHTTPQPAVNRIVRMTDQGGLGTQYTVLREVPARLHNGGRVAFGPDGMLYVTYGDQTIYQAARIADDIRGKILRLLPNGEVPPDNPFGPTNPAAVMGIRNSFGICFDRATGAGYFTDNGGSCDDEVNLLVPGGDYGWAATPCGTQPEGTLLPIFRSATNIVPTGCCVYRDGVYPGLDGSLFVGCYNQRHELRRLALRPGTLDQIDSVEVFATASDRILDVTVGPEGWVWLSTWTTIERIRPPVPTAVVDHAVVHGLSVRPNPFLGAATISATAPNGIQRIVVLDPSGRLVRAWALPPTRSLHWDGRDAGGRPVPPGVYLVRAIGERGAVTQRIVRLAR